MPAASSLSSTTGRSALQLLTAQLRAIDDWNRTAATSVGSRLCCGREEKVDQRRSADTRHRLQQALVARAHQHLLGSGCPTRLSSRPRAILVHRSTWFSNSVAAQLATYGMRTESFSDGATAAGTILVEQPDLVLVEARLPGLSGPDLVRHVRRYAADTVIGAQANNSRSVRELVAVRAHVVFPASIRPADVGDELVSCLLRAREGHAGM